MWEEGLMLFGNLLLVVVAVMGLWAGIWALLQIWHVIVLVWEERHIRRRRRDR